MKKKNKSRKLSDAVNAAKVTKKLNPFEVHINRKKHDVIGKKTKTDRGLPGISRSKAIKKRKDTLLLEYKGKDRRNKFMDRRIGERNTAMTAEDKTLARYTAERMRAHSKKSVFNLGDDEILTHRGQSLTDIEKFEDPKSEDDEDEDDLRNDGKLDSKFVGEAHFGGGIFKKVEGESKSRKDLIDQLIAESKKRKAEKQQMREETTNLTEKLDAEWKDLLPLVTASKKQKGEEDNIKDKKSLSYDVLSKQLKFESRGKPTDRLKSEEELAKEEKEKLEKLERDRIERMHGGVQSEKKWKHKSADDLDDGFETEDIPEVFVKYDDDGNLVNEEGMEVEEGAEDADGASENQPEEIEDASDGEEENKEDEDDDSSSGESVVDLSEFKDDDSESDENEASEETATPELTTVKPSEDKLKVEQEMKEKADSVEKARNELPFTFEVPEEYEGFEELMEKYSESPDHQAVIVERMIKCSHPSLNSSNKVKLNRLFTFLLQHLQDCSTQDSPAQRLCFKVLDRLAPWLFDLTQWAPEECADSIREVLKEKQSDFLRSKKAFPGLDTLIFLKLVSILFPTSDYRHAVATPALLLMETVLSSCRVRSSADVSVGLFLSTLVLEYTAFSKRYVPEAINFLRGTLQLATLTDGHSRPPAVPPFRFDGSFSLAIHDTAMCTEPGNLSTADLTMEQRSDDFNARAVRLAIHLLTQFCGLLDDDPASYLVFEPFLALLNPGQYPACLRGPVQVALDKITALGSRKLQKLVLEKKKPKPLKLYEPCIEQVYSFKKHQPMSKEKQERQKLVYKYKKEMKGALREIRRDRTFIAKLKFKQQQKSDMERQQKVREIFGAAAEQAGELRKIKRKKK